jgi:endonuclease III
MRLDRAYGRRRLRNRRDPLSELIFILLSAQTEEYNYLRTYRALRRRFRTWQRAQSASAEELYSEIRFGGLARKKAAQIHGLLLDLGRGGAPPSLEHLRTLPNDVAEGELVRLPGVGVKTAKCVLMYSLDREVLPVDAHVWRVASRLRGTTRSRKPTVAHQLQLESAVPPSLRYAVHVGFVQHGRTTCLAVRPRCGTCVLREFCALPKRSRFDATTGSAQVDETVVAIPA